MKLSKRTTTEFRPGGVAGSPGGGLLRGRGYSQVFVRDRPKNHPSFSLSTMKNTPKDQQKITCDVHQLAGILGMSARNVQLLEKEGVAVRVGHGKYDLGSSLRNFVAHIEAEASPQEDAEFEIQRTRVYRARAEILEAQSQAMRGELHEAGCIMEVMGDALANFRAKMLAIPTRLAPILADESDPNRCAEIIRDAIYEALTECSKYNAREVVARYIAKQGKARTPIEDEDQKADL